MGKEYQHVSLSYNSNREGKEEGPILCVYCWETYTHAIQRSNGKRRGRREQGFSLFGSLPPLRYSCGHTDGTQRNAHTYTHCEKQTNEKKNVGKIKWKCGWEGQGIEGQQNLSTSEVQWKQEKKREKEAGNLLKAPEIQMLKDKVVPDGKLGIKVLEGLCPAVPIWVWRWYSNHVRKSLSGPVSSFSCSGFIVHVLYSIQRGRGWSNCIVLTCGSHFFLLAIHCPWKRDSTSVGAGGQK